MKPQIEIEGVRAVGSVAHFEYHCLESHDSADAQLWYRSHQLVHVIALSEESDGLSIPTMAERASEGCPLVYVIRFADGFVGHATEDELMDSVAGFFCPNPPQPRTASQPTSKPALH